MDQGTEFQDQVRVAIAASIAAKQLLLADGQMVSMLAEVSEILIDALRNGNKLMVFGNGGSAADAQHIAAEFVGRFAFNRPALPALALSVNTSCLTAIGNDYGFDRVFARQLEALGKKGDVAIGISTSGNSPNVLRALDAANDRGLITVALTGKGGKAGSIAKHHIAVQEDRTARVQEIHATLLHVICELVESELSA